jgi:hypothetical protein
VAQRNKAYVILSHAGYSSNVARVTATYVVLDPSDNVVTGDEIYASFDYGDSNEAIHDSVEATLRSLLDDASLDIKFVS